jgi:hypothetical protein
MVCRSNVQIKLFRYINGECVSHEKCVMAEVVEGRLGMEHSTADNPDEVINRLRAKLMVLDIGNRKLRSFEGLPAMTHAFFPGGNGLYKGVQATRFPIGGTLILGSNFGCLSGFIDAQRRLLILDERGNSTWKPLLQSLDASGIKTDECFFTNAWPFLHEGESNLGPVGDWLQDQALMASCVRIFEYTFKTTQPRLIIGLGIGPAAFLSCVWPKDLSSWKRHNLQGLDDLPMATVHFQEGTTICVAITHPSMPNAWRRRPPYQHRTGEVQLLTEARLKSESISK